MNLSKIALAVGLLFSVGCGASHHHHKMSSEGVCGCGKKASECVCAECKDAGKSCACGGGSCAK